VKEPYRLANSKWQFAKLIIQNLFTQLGSTNLDCGSRPAL
jgi:hypothetical protein